MAAKKKAAGALKKAPVKKAAVKSTAKKAPAKKAPVKKPAVKKAPARKVPVKKPATKAPVKKPAVKKPSPVKKAKAKKPAPAKKAAVKSTAKKSAAKKTTKKAIAKKGGKTTLELLKAIKARDIETHKNAPAGKGAGKAKKAAPKRAPARKKQAPLPIVPPMQKAVEIVASSSKAKTKKRRAKFSKSNLDKFKKDLLLARDHFNGQTDAMKHDALQRDDEVNPEEDGTDAFMRLQALNQMNDQQHIVADIDEALTAIEKGTYGRCEMCECLISKPRLRARPFSKFCIKCKADMERLTHRKKQR